MGNVVSVLDFEVVAELIYRLAGYELGVGGGEVERSPEIGYAGECRYVLQDAAP